MAREKDEKQALEQLLKGDVESGMKINIHHTADALKSSQYEMNALQVVSLPNTSIHHTFGDQFFIFTFWTRWPLLNMTKRCSIHLIETRRMR